MATEADKFKVGLVIVIGTVIGAGAVIWLGVSKYFEETRPFVTYVNESVQGLDRDSPVKYQGVRVGRVSKVSVAPDGRLIEIVLLIEDVKFQPTPRMRIQLAAAGITGIMYMEISQVDPEVPQPPSPAISFDIPHPLIRSRPSELHALIGQINEIFKGLRNIDYAGISEQIKNVLGSTDVLLKGKRLEAILANVEEATASMKRILGDKRWDGIIANVDGTTEGLRSAGDKVNDFLEDPELKTALKDLKASAKSVRATAEFLEEKSMGIELKERVNLTLDRFAEMGLQGSQAARNLSELVSDLHLGLYMTIENLRRTSENLKNVSNIIEAQPSQLLFAEPPERKD